MPTTRAWASRSARPAHSRLLHPPGRTWGQPDRPRTRPPSAQPAHRPQQRPLKTKPTHRRPSPGTPALRPARTTAPGHSIEVSEVPLRRDPLHRSSVNGCSTAHDEHDRFPGVELAGRRTVRQAWACHGEGDVAVPAGVAADTGPGREPVRASNVPLTGDISALCCANGSEWAGSIHNVIPSVPQIAQVGYPLRGWARPVAVLWSRGGDKQGEKGLRCVYPRAPPGGVFGGRRAKGDGVA
jgi:hypothetical protein